MQDGRNEHAREAVERVYRAESRRVLASLIRLLGDFDRAEEALHDAFVAALQPIATATTLRVRNGKMSTTDGPFAETREQLGGYYVVEAKDLNEALQIAAKIPAARTGSIEVRPIVDFGRDAS